MRLTHGFYLRSVIYIKGQPTDKFGIGLLSYLSQRTFPRTKKASNEVFMHFLTLYPVVTNNYLKNRVRFYFLLQHECIVNQDSEVQKPDGTQKSKHNFLFTVRVCFRMCPLLDVDSIDRCNTFIRLPCRLIITQSFSCSGANFSAISSSSSCVYHDKQVRLGRNCLSSLLIYSLLSLCHRP